MELNTILNQLGEILNYTYGCIEDEKDREYLCEAEDNLFKTLDDMGWHDNPTFAQAIYQKTTRTELFNKYKIDILNCNFAQNVKANEKIILEVNHTNKVKACVGMGTNTTMAERLRSQNEFALINSLLADGFNGILIIEVN